MIRFTYPDPDSVLYPTTQPPSHPCRMTTKVTSRVYAVHRHGAWVDRAGNGNTDAEGGHWHPIRYGVVQPDPRDGHTHEITPLPCGVG